MIHRISGKTERFQNVFFDLDGTLTESGPGIINAVRYMLDRVGISEDDEDKLRSFIGPPTTDNLKRLYNFTEEKAQHAYTYFREYYERQGIYESRLYDGITEAIEDIRRSGKRVYLATAKPEHIALMVVKHFGVVSMFERVFAVRRDIGIYNKLQVLQSVATELGSVPWPVMVGDRSFDIEGGLTVGFATVGVLYGYGSREELLAAGCDYLLDSVGDLSALLGRNA